MSWKSCQNDRNRPLELIKRGQNWCQWLNWLSAWATCWKDGLVFGECCVHIQSGAASKPGGVVQWCWSHLITVTRSVVWRWVVQFNVFVLALRHVMSSHSVKWTASHQKTRLQWIQLKVNGKHSVLKQLCLWDLLQDKHKGRSDQVWVTEAVDLLFIVYQPSCHFETKESKYWKKGHELSLVAVLEATESCSTRGARAERHMMLQSLSRWGFLLLSFVCVMTPSSLINSTCQRNASLLTCSHAHSGSDLLIRVDGGWQRQTGAPSSNSIS